MKNLITLIIALLPIIGNGQKLIEVSLNNEDKAIGLNYIDAGNHFIIGAESGLFKYGYAKVEHQKYKIGYSLMFGEMLDGYNTLILTASPCYNKYNVIYNDDHIKRMPKWSFEISARTNLTDRIYMGIQCDIIRCTGGFNLGFLIFK
jgi:hypothetical protein